VAYKADETGFHVTANNLPVFAPGLLPEPVQDTPEVAEAKRQHLAIWKAIADQHAKSGDHSHQGDLRDHLSIPDHTHLRHLIESLMIIYPKRVQSIKFVKFQRSPGGCYVTI